MAVQRLRLMMQQQGLMANGMKGKPGMMMPGMMMGGKDEEMEEGKGGYPGMMMQGMPGMQGMMNPGMAYMTNERVLKLQEKVDKLKLQQMREELQAQAFGIRYSMCNYKCAEKCFQTMFPMQRLKDSLMIVTSCLVGGCRCQKQALPNVETGEQITNYIQQEVMLHNDTYDWQYREKPKPRNYNINF